MLIDVDRVYFEVQFIVQNESEVFVMIYSTTPQRYVIDCCHFLII